MGANSFELKYVPNWSVVLEKKITARVNNISNFILKSLAENDFSISKSYLTFKMLVNDILDENFDDGILINLYRYYLRDSLEKTFSIKKGINIDYLDDLVSQIKLELKKKEWLTLRYLNEGIITRSSIIRYLKRTVSIDLGISDDFQKLLNAIVENFVKHVEKLYQKMAQDSFLSNFLTHRGLVLLSSLFDCTSDAIDNVIDYYKIPLIMTANRITAVTIFNYARGLIGILEEKYDVEYTYLTKPKISLNEKTYILKKKGFSVKFNLEYIKPIQRYVTAVYYPDKVAPLILIVGKYAVLLAPLSDE
ncbi:MAG: hypothetical protein ACP6IS_10845 [Candidatus Asgardarchaeia archaeon]